MENLTEKVSGFNPIILRAQAPKPRGGYGAREIRCESCERRLARVQNFISNGLANVTLRCACGVVTAITMFPR